MNKGKGPGRNYREGITIIQLAQKFPDEETARQWTERVMWPNGRVCPRCKGTDTHEATHKTLPYRCRTCKRFFSVRKGTLLENSRLPYLTWVYAIYLELTSLKGISSMKLHRDIGVSQPTAWYMLQRIREAFGTERPYPFEGPIEVDESYFGGLEKNKHNSKKANLGRGPVGKKAVVGIKDRKTKQVRAKVVDNTDKATLQGFVKENVENGTKVYTDDARAYIGLENHESVKHSVSEYVNGQAHTNGVESFWAVLKRAYHGVYHHVSPKHLQRYVVQFAGKHNIRELDTIEQMAWVIGQMAGKRLAYKDLIA
ncbi:MAG: IS1595 family transposase [Gammaproteobacteria bacterium]|nr:IS1595 family transposase [Gammaproteobacteria bacterium]MYJ21641.1 IS1595 family transposase [Rhodothermaceae bacterium]